MKRIKTLGLAAVTALALTAVLAGHAQASEFEADVANYEVKGTSAPNQTFDLVSSTLLCGDSTLSGSSVSPVKHILTDSLDFGKCAGYPGAPKLNANECQLSFDPDGETSPGTFEGEFVVWPSTCGPLTATYSSGQCTVSIYPENGTATFQNVPAGATPAAVEVTLSASGLKYDKSCDSDGTGKFIGQWLLKAYSGSNQVGLWVEPEYPESPDPGGPLPGIYVAGGQIRADSPEYPQAVSAAKKNFNLFDAGSSKVQCDAGFASTLTAATSTLSLGASFSKCTAFGIANPLVDLNGCSYQLNVEASGSPHTGSQAIKCPFGAAVEVTSILPIIGVEFCTLSIPPQTLGVSTFTNVGEGENRGVAVSTKGSGLQYSVEYHMSGTPFCGPEGSHSNGSFDESMTLKGS